VKVLCCGDVAGRSGRTVLCEQLPRLRSDLGLDFVVVNGENAARGFGITEKICRQFYEAGTDAITTGNHVWDQREIISYIDSDPCLLRPHNYPQGTPGRGSAVFTLGDGRKVLLLHLMTRLFMNALDDPFSCAGVELTKYRLAKSVDAILVDVHGEATSEKTAMGNFLDGRVSVVFGTHSHVPTADARILPGGTAYQTDLGMCGDYDSVIGMKKEAAIARFVKRCLASV
jgi:metallophosphoesterase (TIGR00282 family)